MPPEAAYAGFAFHAGELAVQARAGVAHQAAESSIFIRPSMPEQHRDFFQFLMNILYIGGQDEQGRVWASVLAGEPGFITSDGPTHLAIAPGARLPADPLQLGPGSAVGALGMDASTRRRNRVNASVTAVGPDGGLQLLAEQTTGNCPKYIQVRDVRLDKPRLTAMQRGEAPPGAEGGEGPLGPRQLALIAAADTFFLATCASPAPAHGQKGGEPSDGSRPHLGCDVSHRGGPPGFVQAAGDGRTLRWPDYRGNNFFMSLGNLQVNPAAGLLFIDWLTGDVLQLSGTAETLFEDRSLPGAQRAVRFVTRAWRFAPAALPIRPAPVLDFSPYNPQLPQAAGAAAAVAAAVHVSCVAVREEAAGIKTFSFRAPPGFSHAPGQYASFDFAWPVPGGGTETLNRTWTISSHPSETAAAGAFTISVKRAGLLSSWLHDRLAPGDALQLRGVGGEFVPAAGSSRPALLLAGGIGITPLRVMFLEFMKRGVPASLLYSVRRPEEAAFLADLSYLARRASAAAPPAPDGGPAFRVLPTASGGAPGVALADGWAAGRLDAALVAAAAADPAACDAYLCGPGAFMDAAQQLLQRLGVPPARIFTESFNF